MKKYLSKIVQNNLKYSVIVNSSKNIFLQHVQKIELRLIWNSEFCLKEMPSNNVHL